MKICEVKSIRKLSANIFSIISLRVFSKVGQFPYVVSFRSTSIEGNFHDCGGAILSDRFVLLAAHCIKSNHREPAGYVVSVGAHNQYDGQIYSVKNIYVHNYFLASNLRNDIALIEVHDTIQFSEKVQPIQPGREFIGSGVEAIIAGFGRSNVSKQKFYAFFV